MKILDEITNIETFVDEGNIMNLDDPDLALFPIAYMSEPGYWSPSEAETEGLRNYLKKGGFIIFDDFRTFHNQNLFAQMLRVLPDAVWRPLAQGLTGRRTDARGRAASLVIRGRYRVGSRERDGSFRRHPSSAARSVAGVRYGRACCRWTGHLERYERIGSTGPGHSHPPREKTARLSRHRGLTTYQRAIIDQFCHPEAGAARRGTPHS